MAINCDPIFFVRSILSSIGGDAGKLEGFTSAACRKLGKGFERFAGVAEALD